MLRTVADCWCSVGYTPLGQAGMGDRLLAALLPIQFAEPPGSDPHGFEIRALKNGRIELMTGSAESLQLPNPAAACYYAHRLTPKPTAAVWARAGDQPFLLAHQIGKGRVVAVTGTVLGAEANAFWNSSAWPDIVARLLYWLSGPGT